MSIVQDTSSTSSINETLTFPLSIAMGWSAAGNIYDMASRFLAGVLIVRALSQDDFGTFSYPIWLVGFFCAVGDFGVFYSTSRQRCSTHSTTPQKLLWTSFPKG